MNAASLQHGFAGALLDPARVLPTGLRAATGVDLQRRFNVHRNNATVALVEALVATFPVTRALVGEDFFRDMARERVRADPPRSPVLSEYGEGFAGFIAGFAPAAGLAYLPDLARLEFARVQAYHAEDAVPVGIAAYQALLATPERLPGTCVRLHPACRWLRSEHAVFSLWQAHQLADDLRDRTLAAIDVDVAEEVLVVRPQWEVQMALLPERGSAWLQALHDGGTLAEAASLAHAGPDHARLEALLSLLVHHGLAVALQSPQE